MSPGLRADVEQRIGGPVVALVAVKGRGPKATHLLDQLPRPPWLTIVDGVVWAARYLRQRVTRPLPTFSHVGLGADDRVHLLSIRWGPPHVHRVEGSWDAGDVHVIPRPDLDGFAIDLEIGGKTTPLHLTHPVDAETEALLARLR